MAAKPGGRQSKSSPPVCGGGGGGGAVAASSPSSPAIPLGRSLSATLPPNLHHALNFAGHRLSKPHGNWFTSSATMTSNVPDYGLTLRVLPLGPQSRTWIQQACSYYSHSARKGSRRSENHTSSALIRVLWLYSGSRTRKLGFFVPRTHRTRL
jgi:hypothetical protein